MTNDHATRSGSLFLNYHRKSCKVQNEIDFNEIIGVCAACKVIHFIGDKICHNTAKARVAFLSQRNNELKQQTPSLKSANFLKSSCRDFKKQALLSRRLVRTGLTAVPRVLEDLLLETISWTNFASAFGGRS